MYSNFIAMFQELGGTTREGVGHLGARSTKVVELAQLSYRVWLELMTQSAGDASESFQKLAACRTPQDLVALQQSWLETSSQRAVENLNKLMELTAVMVGSLEVPLSEAAPVPPPAAASAPVEPAPAPAPAVAAPVAKAAAPAPDPDPVPVAPVAPKPVAAAAPDPVPAAPVAPQPVAAAAPEPAPAPVEAKAGQPQVEEVKAEEATPPFAETAAANPATAVPNQAAA